MHMSFHCFKSLPFQWKTAMSNTIYFASWKLGNIDMIPLKLAENIMVQTLGGLILDIPRSQRSGNESPETIPTLNISRIFREKASGYFWLWNGTLSMQCKQIQAWDLKREECCFNRVVAGRGSECLWRSGLELDHFGKGSESMYLTSCYCDYSYKVVIVAHTSYWGIKKTYICLCNSVKQKLNVKSSKSSVLVIFSQFYFMFYGLILDLF